MISSRFDPRIPFFLIIFLSVSFVLSIFVLQLFGFLLAILWLFEKISEKKKAIDSFIIAVCAYGITRLISIALSEYQEASLQSLYKEALFFLSVFFFSFYLRIFDEKKIKTIIYVFVAGAAANAVIGLIRFNLGIVERAESLSSGYTVFSGYLVAVLGIALILFSLNDSKKKYSYLVILSTGLILAGIITSLGRANIAVAGLLVFTSFFLKMVNLKQIILIMIIAAGISGLSFVKNSSGVTGRIEAPAQLSDRDIILKGAGELVWEHPVFGFGPRTFKKIFPFKDEFADTGIGGWHNHVLQIYFESGLLGLAAYIYLLVISFITGFKALKRKENENIRIIIKGILLSLSALFLSAFFSGFIDSPILSIEFAFLVSLMTSVIYRKTSNG